MVQKQRIWELPQDITLGQVAPTGRAGLSPASSLSVSLTAGGQSPWQALPTGDLGQGVFTRWAAAGTPPSWEEGTTCLA